MPVAEFISSTRHIEVKVLYFAAIKDLTGISTQTITIPSDLHHRDFMSYLIKLQPKLATPQAQALLRTCACAINMEYSYLDDHKGSCFEDGDEVALIPPVSGG